MDIVQIIENKMELDIIEISVKHPEISKDTIKEIYKAGVDRLVMELAPRLK